MRSRPTRITPPLGPPKASSKQKILAAWRGLDTVPLECAIQDASQALGNLMPSVLRGLRMDRRRKEAEIVRVWNSLLDPAVIQHAQPAGLHQGTLFVNVDNSVWLSELVRYRRQEILKRLQHSFGKEMIQRLSFRIG